MPKELNNVVDGVFGLDTRPVGQSKRSKSHFPAVPWKDVAAVKTGKANTQNALPGNPYKGTFYPSQVAQLYNFPEDADGNGQNIAV